MEPEKQLNYKLKICVYGKNSNTMESHSFLVDNVPTGISSHIGELNIDIRKMTLKQLRPIIQYDMSGGMSRRSLMFNEALFIMGRLPNYYDRPTGEMNKYQFGFIKKDGSDFRIVSTPKEDILICDLIGTIDFFSYDLLIVPLSQIPPE